MIIKRKKKFYVLLIVTVLSMLAIFLISHTPYQNQDIKPFLANKLNNLDLTLPYVTFSYDGQQISTANQPAFIEFLIRKIGHVVGYFFLTILTFVTLSYTSFSVKYRYVLTFLIAFTYAGLDEWHQYFVSGRTGHWQDVVFFDGFGIVLAIGLIFIVRFILVRNNKENLDY